MFHLPATKHDQQASTSASTAEFSAAEGSFSTTSAASSSSSSLHALHVHARWYINASPFAKWRFPKMGIPQNGWFLREHLIKMDDLGVLPVQKTIYDKLQKSLQNLPTFLRTFPILAETFQVQRKLGAFYASAQQWVPCRSRRIRFLWILLCNLLIPPN